MTICCDDLRIFPVDIPVELQTLRQLDHICFDQEHGRFEDWQWFYSRGVLKAVQNREPVGLISWFEEPMHPALSQDRWGYISNICVAPTYRDRGIGTQLLESCIQAMKDSGISRFHLHVFCDNAPAIYLYSQIGFHNHSLVTNYYKGKDAWLMIKTI